MSAGIVVMGRKRINHKQGKNMKEENRGRWNKKQLDICYFAGFILLIGLISFLSFYKLDAKYVDPWDEARHGVNAYEMYKEGNLIQSTYLYDTDYYNLKPLSACGALWLPLHCLGRMYLHCASIQLCAM